ncbi:MAG: TonB-dependent receptor [Pseudomonadota bacterium]
MVKKSLIRKFRPSLLASTIATVIAGSGYTGVIYAQEGDEVEEVVVTGSRIARRDFSANSPITTTDELRFEESSTIAMESVLNQLPQFVPAATQFEAVPTGTLAAAGSANITPTASSVSLRGLGSNRNLVLLNGRRAMPVDASMAVDINSIPAAAIARVETITGGASSVYGADAVAGVVNFIIKDDLEGMDFDYQYGMTEQGDGNEESLSVVFGQGFGNNGNIMIGIERYTRDRVWQKDRDFYTEGWADPGSQGGINAFYMAPYASNAVANPFNQAVVDSIFGPNNGINARQGGNYYLNADGTVYRGQREGNQRYNGPLLTEDGLVYRKRRADTGALIENWVDYQESSPLERESLFSSAKIDVSENIVAFAQGMLTSSESQNRRRTGGMVGGWGGSVPHGNNIYAPSVSAGGATNPDYLPGGRYGLNCGPTGGCTNSQVWPKSPEMQRLLDSRTNPNANVDVGAATTWFGNVRNDVATTNYQLMLGLEGQLPDLGWSWEAYVSSGTSQTTNDNVGSTSVERWRYVINQPNYGTNLYRRGNEAGAGFGAGSITCTSGFGILGQGEKYYPAATGYSDAAPSQDCMDAIEAAVTYVSKMEQTVYEANLQGGLFELPAGELGFALGSSYRENHFRWIPPAINTPESVFDTPAGAYPRSETNGEISAAEVYGELLVPVLAEVPFIQRLDLELGYRYTDNDPTDAVSSWKALVNWDIIDQVRFRGGYQVANRAPNIAELFQSADQFLFTRTKGDWCSDRNPANAFSPNPALNANSAQARAVCEALMGAQGASTYYTNPDRPNTSTQFYFSNVTGNANLKEETAKTITLGFVADLLDNLTLTVDWWNIKIDDMISTEDPDNIYQLCLSPATNPTFSPAHPACEQIERNPDSGAEGNTPLLYTNQGAIDFAGYDIALNWNTDLGPGVLNLNTSLTIADKMETRTSPTQKFNDWKGTSGPSDLIGLNGYAYDWRSFVSANYSLGLWSGSLRWRHLPSIESEAAGRPGNTEQPTNAYDIFDFSGRYAFSDTINLRVGIDNLLDVEPERTFTNATNTASGQTNRNFYDILGRRYYLGLNMKF